ncbi:hypothetical protein EJ05DRAFT_386429 [Pseudovirgaria hyperparasitica]|uniref:Uncharacterized protein n=1 Tax=Pseudovirgaria hyperparasitica TaxID=470096 RepID=A0A6A6W3Y3_9PEZI|nr:uncharacterized protein EJ05DRAFT_386429 [Pseudovirgaria hyperparasitica]KAF2757323.1 hypothetical protein EJ05DRAFT_386429 [Pseudovirgaria hyperparasitica]
MATLTDDRTSTVDPALAQEAQIPLQTFEIPSFPPEAQGLRALILTCDIKTDEYTELLKTHVVETPSLPKCITSLTLELFSLGYPPGFLTTLAKALPNVKELVVYSQMLGGITKDSEADAIQAFQEWKELRSLHLLDVFAKPHFFQRIGEGLRKRETGLMFLEINYTFRHEDENFLTRVPAGELPLLITPGLITCALNLAPSEETQDEQDPSNLSVKGDKSEIGKDGVMAFNKTLSPDLVEELTKEEKPKDLRMLNITLYTIDVDQLIQILKYHKALVMLSATLHCEPTEGWKQKLLEALALCPELEQVEIVGNPSLEFAMLMSNPKRRPETISKTFPSEADMTMLSISCPKLKSMAANILRTTYIGTASWKKVGESWKGGIQKPDSSDESKDSMPGPGSQIYASA